MPDDRTALDHLLQGREALTREVERLTAAIAELDSVIGQIGGAGLRVHPAGDEPVNRRADVELSARTGRASAKRAPVGRVSAATPAADQPKSIRVHVLDMLAAEDREFGLAEIIDRIHAAGIQAHDDAVRSITIKLMKDGRVERVGRGQYRLVRGGAARGSEPATASGYEWATPSESAPLAPAPTDGVPAATTPDESDSDAPASYTPPLNLGQPWEPGA